MKNKNPLYVVKGKDVEQASSLFDLVIKKFNLEPAIAILKNVFNLLLKQVENFAMFQVVKKFIEDLIRKIQELGQRAGLLSV